MTLQQWWVCACIVLGLFGSGCSTDLPDEGGCDLGFADDGTECSDIDDVH